MPKTVLPRTALPKPAWTSDWTIGVRLWMERRGEAVLGEGRAELLAAIGRTHSITAAAKSVGMSYRRAWNIVQEVNQAAGDPLVTAAVGGATGGGAQLTPHGHFAVDLFEQLHTAVRHAAAGMLHRIVATGPEADCVHLSAAISLQEAVGQILTDYALQNPAVKVRAVFGASNELADHLLAGAPGDLFITGDAAHLDRLHAAGKIDTRGRRTVAANGLAAICLAGKLSSIHAPGDLASKKIKHVAVADEASPLGGCTRQYLAARRLYDALSPKLVQVDNARAVVTAVHSGAAEVGLSFTSDAAMASGCRTLFHVPASQASVQYEAAVLRGGQRIDAARELLKFLSSPQAARSFRRCGLRPAGKEK
ncbi:MAG: molybdate ABC transporter substrate-binding protein [Planctomycetia bacterium]|nr:molybdate ABC transporter substrate-binding protein [Planctomycetia bacterium]